GIPDEDIAYPMNPTPVTDPAGRWHEVFVQAARDWLGAIDDEERLLLGLRWRYRLSQREAAKLFGLNEGTLTRRTDKLRDRALESIGERLGGGGWTGGGAGRGGGGSPRGKGGRPLPPPPGVARAPRGPPPPRKGKDGAG